MWTKSAPTTPFGSGTAVAAGLRECRAHRCLLRASRSHPHRCEALPERAAVLSRTDRLVAAGLFASLLLANCWLSGGSAVTDSSLPFDDVATSDVIRTIVGGGGPPLRRPHDLRAVQDGLAVLYPPPMAAVWTKGGQPTPEAVAAVLLLQDAGTQGLVADDYDAPWLRQTLDAISRDASSGSVERALFDTALSVEVLRFLRAVHRGRVRPEDVGFAYHSDMDYAELAARLQQALGSGGVAALLADLEPRYPQYARLKQALARYRQTPSSPETEGRIRQLELAMERLRWLPHAPEGRFLVANVPAFRLVAFSSVRDARPALQMAIVVGKAARTETPLFADELTHVLFRPSWYPPPSILRKEIVPILRRDPGYLRREHMDVVAATSDNSPALAWTPNTLDRLRSGQLALRQNPGPHNALGLVKFVFPNEYRVYMHDTPAHSLFARKRRDFSHGCIRVERPAELAEFVLSGTPGWTLERIGGAMRGTRTIRAEVVAPIPVFVFYTTAIVRADGTVEFFDDIYGLDGRLARALTAVGGP